MGAPYSVAFNRAGINTANSIVAELRTGASARATLRQVTVSQAVLSTTIPRLVLARTTNSPVGGTAATPIPMDPADGAALTACYSVVGGTPPTFTTAGPWLVVAGLPLTLGAGFIWTFPGEGLVIPLSSSLVLANLNASGATLGSLDVSLTFEE